MTNINQESKEATPTKTPNAETETETESKANGDKERRSIDDEVDKLEKNITECASDTRRAFLIYVTVTIYMIIAVFSTTDEQLVRGSFLKLPVIDVDISIVGFYVLAPLLLFLLHLNFLGELNTLKDRADKWKRERGSKETPSIPFGFCHLFFPAQRSAVPRRLICSITYLSTIVLPLFTFLIVQIRFLPYHSEGVTAVHSGLFLLSIFSLLLFWPRGPIDDVEPKNPESPIRVQIWRYLRERKVRVAAFLFALVLIAPLNVLIITVAQSWFEKKAVSILGSSQSDVRQLSTGGDGAALAAEEENDQRDQVCSWSWNLRRLFDVINTSTCPTYLGHRNIYNGWERFADGESREMPFLSYALFEAPSSRRFMRRNLVVSNTDFVDRRPPVSLDFPEEDGDSKRKEAWERLGLGIDLRGRDLRFADFSESDFSGADLRGANLYGAKLLGATLDYAKLKDIQESEIGSCHAIENSNEDKANDDNDASDEAKVTEGELISSHPKKDAAHTATIGDQEIRVCRTNLTAAWLENVNLKGAQMVKAVMSDVFMSGIKLNGADLSRAILDNAYGKFGDFREAKLNMASLKHAHLMRAQFGKDASYADNKDLIDINKKKELLLDKRKWVDLKEANFTEAKLAGAEFFNALLVNAKFDNIDIYYYKKEDPEWASIYLSDVDGVTWPHGTVCQEGLRDECLELAKSTVRQSNTQ